MNSLRLHREQKRHVCVRVVYCYVPIPWAQQHLPSAQHFFDVIFRRRQPLAVERENSGGGDTCECECCWGCFVFTYACQTATSTDETTCQIIWTIQLTRRVYGGIGTGSDTSDGNEGKMYCRNGGNGDENGQELNAETIAAKLNWLPNTTVMSLTVAFSAAVSGPVTKLSNA